MLLLFLAFLYLFGELVNSSFQIKFLFLLIELGKTHFEFLIMNHGEFNAVDAHVMNGHIPHSVLVLDLRLPYQCYLHVFPDHNMR